MAVKLKICGVKTVSEARQLRELGVDYVGLNFIPESPRLISLDAAESIVAALQGSSVKTVALFRNQPSETVNEYASRLGADYVQLHGDESAEYARSVTKPVIKAIAVDPAVSATELIDFTADYPAAYFLLDRHEQGRGDIVGTGIARQVVDCMPDKVCLAGGLTTENLKDVLIKVHPYAIDISRGVRTDEAIDMAKVSRCLEIIRSMPASRH